MVDTKKIRSNLGSRDSISLRREDVLELLYMYEVHAEEHRLHNAEKEHRGLPTKAWVWTDFAPKH